MRSPTSRGLTALGAAAALAALAPAASSAAPQAEVDAAVQRGGAWIADQQDRLGSGAANPSPTGGLPGFNGNWAVTTLAAAGINAADVQEPGVPKSLQDYTYEQYLPGGASASMAAFGGSTVAGGFGREALIASSAGIQVTKLRQDFNLTASLASRWRVAQGDFGGFAPNSDGFALLATESLKLPKGVRQKIVAKLLTAQKTSTTPAPGTGLAPFGGWSFTASTTGTGDIDMTGAVLSMVCQEGMTPADTAVADGIAFLKARLNQTTGGLGTVAENFIPPNTTPSAAWALVGLKACGVDPQGADWTTSSGKNPVRFLLDQQRVDAGVPGAFGSLRYVPTSTYPAAATDMNSTEAGIRALSNHRWAAPAPVRANPANPRLRPAPTVADGQTVPIALAVDPGDGDVRFCGVHVLSGDGLQTVLEKARTTSVPAGCVDDVAATGGTIRTINGDTRGWQVRLSEGAPQVARDQAVRFGDVVSLEVSFPALAPAAADFGAQPQATIGAPQRVTFTAAQDGVVPARVDVDGADATDFLVARDGCSGTTLAEGQACTLDLRFAPSSAGAKTAALRLQDPARRAISADVPLTGTGGALPQGPQGDAGGDGARGDAGTAGTSGAPGATGTAGPSGPQGAAGATGPGGSRGPKGDTGARGDDAVVACRVTRGRSQRVTCSVADDAATSRRVSARLTWRNRTYATGTVRGTRTSLQATRRRTIKPGRYTLRVGTGRRTTNLAVVVTRSGAAQAGRR